MNKTTITAINTNPVEAIAIALQALTADLGKGDPITDSGVEFITRALAGALPNALFYQVRSSKTTLGDQMGQLKEMVETGSEVDEVKMDRKMQFIESLEAQIEFDNRLIDQFTEMYRQLIGSDWKPPVKATPRSSAGSVRDRAAKLLAASR